MAKNSSKGRWALESHFADLFDPSLEDDAFVEAAETWRQGHLSPSAKLRVQYAAEGQENSHATVVTLPGNVGTRKLEAGVASHILKGVIEDWAPSRLQQPYVVTISEPGDKVFMADAKLLATLNIMIDVSDLLPDALIADLQPHSVQFWFVEAVNSDGEINEARKARLLAWALSQKIDPEDCFFLTAFSSRNSPAARKRLKDLASGTFAYFADEPGQELEWYAISDKSYPNNTL